MHRPLTVTVLLLPCTLALLACSGDLTVAENGRDGGISPGTGQASIEGEGGGADNSMGTNESTSAPLHDASTAFDALVFGSALADASVDADGPFEVLYGGLPQTPFSCPTSNWEFPWPSSGPFDASSTGTVTVRNTGGVPLAYIAEQMGWILGVAYSPGVPTGESGEEVGVLAPGQSVDLVLQACTGVCSLGLVGASKPFSVRDGGYAAADEKTTPWPQGVAGSEGSSTMYVAGMSAVTVACSPVHMP